MSVENDVQCGPPRPFLKWAGGKRWLGPIAPSLIPRDPGRYFEPFLGSGAVFFAVRPERSTLSDTNQMLIETFQQVRDDPEGVIAALTPMAFGKRSYTRIRKLIPELPSERAARMIYLNKCGWNGVYRVNKRGIYNVPFGPRKRPPKIFDDDGIRAASVALRGAELSAIEFGTSIAEARVGDFVFADPPYTVVHGENGFVKYNERIFSWEDQKKLRNALVAFHKRGGLFLMSNANHHSIRRLYSG